MATTQEDIRVWLELGLADNATHLIVVCDSFDYDDYPVFVYPDEDVMEVKKKYDGVNMQKIMEVYNLSMDWDTQLNQHRSFNY